MVHEFKLPDLGEGVHEGEVVRWLVRAGDRVRRDQPLVEVMTDKVTAEIPSPYAGRVARIEVPEGEVVQVGTVLVAIETDPDGARPGPAPPAPAEARARVAAPEPADAETAGGERALAVPAVRKLARDLAVDLAQVRGTGPAGRIMPSDVRAFAAHGGEQPASAAPRASGPEPGPERLPLRGVRRQIATHLLQASQQTAPYTFVDEADLTELVALRERLKPLVADRGLRLTYLPFVAAAVVAALRRYPVLNGRVDEPSGDLVLSPACHLGIAVDTPDGLIVPVVRDAGQRGILDLAGEIQRLSEAARAGTLSREESQGSTFTITSLGQRGGLLATPIINTPEVAILGVHRITPRPVVRDGQVVVRQIANLSLTFDHRYVDGGAGADFAAALIGYLQDPALMMFWLAELRE
jgi:pyruvate dehydrogenase E2 component (dihydrolipoamide acetyltransferase)